MAPARTRLQRLLALLAKVQGRAAPHLRDAWHLILAENVVYLADDVNRARAFAALERQTGLQPALLAECPDELLLPICGLGRMADQRILKLRTCAELFRTVGDPNQLVQLPAAQARKALKRFPGIGDPGADRLLLFGGDVPVLPLDSNALRVLLRLGYGSEAKSYAASYRSAQRAAAAELPERAAPLRDAAVRLRHHGQHLCRNTAPQCPQCPLRRDCPHAAAAT